MACAFSFLLTLCRNLLLLTVTFSPSFPHEADTRLIGDVLALLGALCYALSNTFTEGVVKLFDRVEYLAMLGLYGTIVCTVQLYAHVSPSLTVVALFWSTKSSTRCLISPGRAGFTSSHLLQPSLPSTLSFQLRSREEERRC